MIDLGRENRQCASRRQYAMLQARRVAGGAEGNSRLVSSARGVATHEDAKSGHGAISAEFDERSQFRGKHQHHGNTGTCYSYGELRHSFET